MGTIFSGMETVTPPDNLVRIIRVAENAERIRIIPNPIVFIPFLIINTVVYY